MAISKKITAVEPGKIIDLITGNELNDTPEEFVRQNIELALIEEYKYPKNHMDIEFSIKMGQKTKRADIVIFHTSEMKQENIYIIIEAKKPNISPKDKKEGVEQLKSYLSACINSKFGVWTNGIERKVFNKTEEKGKFKFEEIPDFPKYGMTLEDLEAGPIELRPVVGTSLLSIFKRCHNFIYANQGLSKQRAFEEFLKIILAKIFDEKMDYKSFYARPSELKSNSGYSTIKSRVTNLFQELLDKSDYGEIFHMKNEIELNPNIISYIVSQMQYIDFLRTDTDVKGVAYEELVGANLRGDRGEFFTPRNIIKMAVKVLDLEVGQKILDPACGTGGFLIYVFKELVSQIKDRNHKRDNPLPEQEIFKEILEVTKKIYGIDFNPDLTAVAKLNMLMNEDGKENVFAENSLQNPNLWKSERARNEVKLESFDIIVTNPPFGTKIPIKDRDILKQFELAYIWKKSKTSQNWLITKKLQSSVPPEVLFIERCVQFLKKGGKLAMVVPDGILGNPKYGYIRQWILKNCKVLASIDLPPDTFQPHTGTQTSIIVLQKKIDEEKLIESASGRVDYQVFFAVVNDIGWDKRGNPIYKTDDYGREILDENNKRIVNDETIDVVEAWNKIKKS